MYQLRKKADKLAEEGKPDEARRCVEEVKALQRQRSELPYGDPLDPNYRRLNYVRYADDFLVGIIGAKADAEQVMQRIKTFLDRELKLEASPEKSTLSKATNGTRFLGYEVRTSGTATKEHRVNLNGQRVKSRITSDAVRLNVPKDRLFTFADRCGYGNLDTLKAKHRKYLIDSSDFEMVLAYNAEMRGLQACATR
ncbi:reverse transcriptase domain-containing protein [Nitrosococcus wardiae]|nr:reverse transcriptase domain-containing protein [Nitrosococcus wardiae]